MNKEQQCDRNAFKEDGPSSSGGAVPPKCSGMGWRGRAVGPLWAMPFK